MDNRQKESFFYLEFCQRVRARRCGPALCFESVVEPGEQQVFFVSIQFWDFLMIIRFGKKD